MKKKAKKFVLIKEVILNTTPEQYQLFDMLVSDSAVESKVASDVIMKMLTTPLLTEIKTNYLKFRGKTK